MSRCELREEMCLPFILDTLFFVVCCLGAVSLFYRCFGLVCFSFFVSLRPTPSAPGGAHLSCVHPTCPTLGISLMITFRLSGTSTTGNLRVRTSLLDSKIVVAPWSRVFKNFYHQVNCSFHYVFSLTAASSRYKSFPLTKYLFHRKTFFFPAIPPPLHPRGRQRKLKNFLPRSNLFSKNQRRREPRGSLPAESS